MRFLIVFEMFLNPDFKFTTCFDNVARTAASKSKFKYQESFKLLGIWSL